MNQRTMEAFPSLDLIAEDSGCSKPTVQKAVQNIAKKGYIEIIPKKRGNVYKFNNEKHFEPFSYDFLDNKELTKSEKLQILCTQQYMYKENGKGTIAMADSKLAKLTGLDRSTIARNNKSLINKNYATQMALCTKDPECGVSNQATIYELTRIGQAIVFSLQNHEDRINLAEQDLEDLKAWKAQQEKRDELYLREIHELKEQLKNAIKPTTRYNIEDQ